MTNLISSRNLLMPLFGVALLIRCASAIEPLSVHVGIGVGVRVSSMFAVQFSLESSRSILVVDSLERFLPYGYDASAVSHVSGLPYCYDFQGVLVKDALVLHAGAPEFRADLTVVERSSVCMNFPSDVSGIIGSRRIHLSIYNAGFLRQAAQDGKADSVNSTPRDLRGLVGPGLDGGSSTRGKPTRRLSRGQNRSFLADFSRTPIQTSALSVGTGKCSGLQYSQTIVKESRAVVTRIFFQGSGFGESELEMDEGAGGDALSSIRDPVLLRVRPELRRGLLVPHNVRIALAKQLGLSIDVSQSDFPCSLVPSDVSLVVVFGTRAVSLPRWVFVEEFPAEPNLGSERSKQGPGESNLRSEESKVGSAGAGSVQPTCRLSIGDIFDPDVLMLSLDRSGVYLGGNAIKFLGSFGYIPPARDEEGSLSEKPSLPFSPSVDSGWFRICAMQWTEFMPPSLWAKESINGLVPSVIGRIPIRSSSMVLPIEFAMSDTDKQGDRYGQKSISEDDSEALALLDVLGSFNVIFMPLDESGAEVSKAGVDADPEVKEVESDPHLSDLVKRFFRNSKEPPQVCATLVGISRVLREWTVCGQAVRDVSLRSYKVSWTADVVIVKIRSEELAAHLPAKVSAVIALAPGRATTFMSSDVERPDLMLAYSSSKDGTGGATEVTDKGMEVNGRSMEISGDGDADGGKGKAHSSSVRFGKRLTGEDFLTPRISHLDRLGCEMPLAQWKRLQDGAALRSATGCHKRSMRALRQERRSFVQESPPGGAVDRSSEVIDQTRRALDQLHGLLSGVSSETQARVPNQGAGDDSRTTSLEDEYRSTLDADNERLANQVNAADFESREPGERDSIGSEEFLDAIQGDEGDLRDDGELGGENVLGECERVLPSQSGPDASDSHRFNANCIGAGLSVDALVNLMDGMEGGDSECDPNPACDAVRIQRASWSTPCCAILEPPDTYRSTTSLLEDEPRETSLQYLVAHWARLQGSTSGATRGTATQIRCAYSQQLSHTCVLEILRNELHGTKCTQSRNFEQSLKTGAKSGKHLESSHRNHLQNSIAFAIGVEGRRKADDTTNPEVDEKVDVDVSPNGDSTPFGHDEIGTSTKVETGSNRAQSSPNEGSSKSAGSKKTSSGSKKTSFTEWVAAESRVEIDLKVPDLVLPDALYESFVETFLKLVAPLAPDQSPTFDQQSDESCHECQTEELQRGDESQQRQSGPRFGAVVTDEVPMSAEAGLSGEGTSAVPVARTLRELIDESARIMSETGLFSSEGIHPNNGIVTDPRQTILPVRTGEPPVPFFAFPADFALSGEAQSQLADREKNPEREKSPSVNHEPTSIGLLFPTGRESPSISALRRFMAETEAKMTRLGLRTRYTGKHIFKCDAAESLGLAVRLLLAGNSELVIPTRGIVKRIEDGYCILAVRRYSEVLSSSKFQFSYLGSSAHKSKNIIILGSMAVMSISGGLLMDSIAGTCSACVSKHRMPVRPQSVPYQQTFETVMSPRGMVLLETCNQPGFNPGLQLVTGTLKDSRLTFPAFIDTAAISSDQGSSVISKRTIRTIEERTGLRFSTRAGFEGPTALQISLRLSKTLVVPLTFQVGSRDNIAIVISMPDLSQALANIQAQLQNSLFFPALSLSTGLNYFRVTNDPSMKVYARTDLDADDISSDESLSESSRRQFTIDVNRHGIVDLTAFPVDLDLQNDKAALESVLGLPSKATANAAQDHPRDAREEASRSHLESTSSSEGEFGEAEVVRTSSEPEVSNQPEASNQPEGSNEPEVSNQPDVPSEPQLSNERGTYRSFDSGAQGGSEIETAKVCFAKCYRRPSTLTLAVYNELTELPWSFFDSIFGPSPTAQDLSVPRLVLLRFANGASLSFPTVAPDGKLLVSRGRTGGARPGESRVVLGGPAMRYGMHHLGMRSKKNRAVPLPPTTALMFSDQVSTHENKSLQLMAAARMIQYFKHELELFLLPDDGATPTVSLFEKSTHEMISLASRVYSDIALLAEDGSIETDRLYELAGGPLIERVLGSAETASISDATLAFRHDKSERALAMFMTALVDFVSDEKATQLLSRFPYLTSMAIERVPEDRLISLPPIIGNENTPVYLTRVATEKVCKACKILFENFPAFAKYLPEVCAWSIPHKESAVHVKRFEATIKVRILMDLTLHLKRILAQYSEYQTLSVSGTRAARESFEATRTLLVRLGVDAQTLSAVLRAQDLLPVLDSVLDLYASQEVERLQLEAENKQAVNNNADLLKLEAVADMICFTTDLFISTPSSAQFSPGVEEAEEVRSTEPTSSATAAVGSVDETPSNQDEGDGGEESLGDDAPPLDHDDADDSSEDGGSWSEYFDPGPLYDGLSVAVPGPNGLVLASAAPAYDPDLTANDPDLTANDPDRVDLPVVAGGQDLLATESSTPQSEQHPLLASLSESPVLANSPELLAQLNRVLTETSVFIAENSQINIDRVSRDMERVSHEMESASDDMERASKDIEVASHERDWRNPRDPVRSRADRFLAEASNFLTDANRQIDEAQNALEENRRVLNSAGVDSSSAEVNSGQLSVGDNVSGDPTHQSPAQRASNKFVLIPPRDGSNQAFIYPSPTQLDRSQFDASEVEMLLASHQVMSSLSSGKGLAKVRSIRTPHVEALMAIWKKHVSTILQVVNFERLSMWCLPMAEFASELGLSYSLRMTVLHSVAKMSMNQELLDARFRLAPNQGRRKLVVKRFEPETAFSPENMELLLSATPFDLLYDTNVIFQKEDGLDAGALTRDYFILAAEYLRNSEEMLFVPVSTADGLVFYVFNPQLVSTLSNEKVFRDSGMEDLVLVAGKVFAWAMYNQVPFDLRLSRVIALRSWGLAMQEDDLRESDPETTKNLDNLIDSEDETLEQSYLDFSMCQSCAEARALEMNAPDFHADDGFGDWTDRAHSCQLVCSFIKGNTGLTRTSMPLYYRAALVHSLLHLDSIFVRAFAKGFWSIMPHALVEYNLFSRDELLDMMFGSLAPIDIEEMQKFVDYGPDGDHEEERNSPTVALFWIALEKFSQIERQNYLLWVISQRTFGPDGPKSLSQRMRITLTKEPLDSLPTVHSCFYQLMLPRYEDEATLTEKLKRAIVERTTQIR